MVRIPSGSAKYGVPASAGGNRHTHNAPEPSEDMSKGPSVKSVSHHKSASGLAHSTTLTRFERRRAHTVERPRISQPRVPRSPGSTASPPPLGDEVASLNSPRSVHRGHVRQRVELADVLSFCRTLIMRGLQFNARAPRVDVSLVGGVPCPNPGLRSVNLELGSVAVAVKSAKDPLRTTGP
jgi:hypothetical protein